MATTTFVRLARRDDVRPGEGLRVDATDFPIALFDVEGRVLAIDDGCARCGSSLADGTVHGTTVACGGCGWQYDLGTGAVVGIPALRLDTYEVTVADGAVMLATPRGLHRPR